MLKKARILIILVSLSVCLGLMSSTYSRYVTDATSNIDIQFAKWQILINNTDITSSSEDNIEFTPIIEENQHVKNNTIAPSSKGYFDIEIDPTNIEVSFKYSLELNIENEDLLDLMIAQYTIIPYDYDEEDLLTLIDLEDNIITNSLYIDNEIEDFKFEKFTLRIYFEWYEGEDELMDDNADTEKGLLAATEDTSLIINANISFEQIFE